jgi:AcrR family transcriptional regulator
MGARTRRERKKREARERIVETCERLFRERGLDRTTVEEIAEAADISRQTFFNYFPSKEAALTEVGFRWMDASQAAAVEAVRGGPPEASVLSRMGAALRAQMRLFEADRAFARLVFTRSGVMFPQGPHVDVPADKARLERTRGLFAGNVALVRAGQSRGEIRDDASPEQIAEILVATMYVTVRLALTDYWEVGADLEPRVMRAMELVIGGLATRPGLAGQRPVETP